MIFSHIPEEILTFLLEHDNHSTLNCAGWHPSFNSTMANGGVQLFGVVQVTPVLHSQLSYWKLRKLTNEWCLFFYIFIYIFSRAFIIWQNSFTLPKPHGLPLPLGLHVDIASHQIFSSTSSDLLIRLFSSTLFWPILCSFWLLSLFKCCVHYIFQSIAQYHTFCLIFTRFINDCVLIRKLDSESVDL